MPISNFENCLNLPTLVFFSIWNWQKMSFFLKLIGKIYCQYWQKFCALGMKFYRLINKFYFIQKQNLISSNCYFFFKFSKETFQIFHRNCCRKNQEKNRTKNAGNLFSRINVNLSLRIIPNLKWIIRILLRIIVNMIHWKNDV